MNFRLVLIAITALAAFPSSTRSQPPPPESVQAIQAKVRQVAAAVSARRSEEAKAAMTEAAAIAGSDLRLLKVFAGELQAIGQNALAVQLCEQLKSLAGDDPVYHGIWGAALVEIKRYGDAVTHLELALRKMPETPEFLSRLAKAKLFLSREAEAMAAIEAALKARPNDAYTLGVRAEVEFRNMRLKECEATCEAILKRFPRSGIGAQLLVRVRRMDGRPEDAIAAADRVFASGGSESEGEVRLERGIACLAVGRTEEGVKDFERAAELLPGDEKPFLHLMKAYKKLGLNEKADHARRSYEERSAGKNQ